MIQFKNLYYSISGKPILENIDLTIQTNEFVAIIGPNGAGKSTLIKALLGIVNDYQGEIHIDGVSNREWLKQHQIGYLPQKEDFDRSFPATVLQLCLMGRATKRGLFHPFRKEDIALARQALERVGILPLAHKQIGNLSGGEMQRLLLARALVTESDYLILDEPEAGIDRPGVIGFFDLLQELHQQGKTIITISHDLHTLNNYCTFLVCLNRILHCHTKTELLTAEVIHKTFGDAVMVIEKDY